MPVPVMDVRIVRMGVREHRVLVRVAVRPPRIPGGVVRVLVRVALGEMEIHAGRHQRAGDPKVRRSGLAETGDRHGGTDEGAVEKYAPVRAVPRPRRARTNSTRLTP